MVQCKCGYHTCKKFYKTERQLQRHQAGVNAAKKKNSGKTITSKTKSGKIKQIRPKPEKTEEKLTQAKVNQSKNLAVEATKLQIEISPKNACVLDAISTDELTFSEAFGYYRKCLGNDSRFQWKGVEYTTLLSKEVIIQVADSVHVDSNPEGAEVSKIR